MCSLANSEDPDEMPYLCGISLEYTLFAMTKTIFDERNTFYYVETITCDPSGYTMDHLASLLHQTKRKNSSGHKGLYKYDL